MEEVATIREVKMQELSSGILNKKIELPGQIDAIRKTRMGFEVPGRVIDILVDEGEQVTEGQLLAILDPLGYKATMNAAAAQRDSAKLEADRAEELYKRQATSKQRLDMAMSNFEVAKANFELAEKSYNDTFLRAPYPGAIAKVYVDDIENVQAKQDILMVQDNSSLQITVDIPETLGALAKPDLSLEERTKRASPMVYLTAVPDRGFPAVITEMSSVADVATRTFEGTLVFDTPKDINILPGMTARLVVTLDEAEREVDATRFVVSSRSIAASNQGNAYVWVIDKETNAVRRQQVETRSISGSEVEIASNELSDGDLIAISGVHKLREGDIVGKFGQ